MKKLAIVAVVPLFAGYLCAQTNQSSSSTTTTTWNGTLVDAGCRTTHTQNKETNSNENSTTTKTQTSTSTECPVTETTTSFGLMTPEGKYLQFDQPGNTQVVEMIKKHHKWHTYIQDKQPIKVRVVGTPNGDTVVVREVQ